MCFQAAGGLVVVVVLVLLAAASSSEGCRTAPTSSLSFSVHFVLLNHKGTRDAESFVQVALKARPPEVFKCSLEVD